MEENNNNEDIQVIPDNTNDVVVNEETPEVQAVPEIPAPVVEVQEIPEEKPTTEEVPFEEEKKSKTPIIVGIIFLVLVVGGYFGVRYLMDKGIIVVKNNDGDSNYVHIDPPKQQEVTYNWNDYKMSIGDVEFEFPMSFSDFKEKIEKTNYKLSSRSTLDKKVSLVYNEDDYLIYEFVVRESGDGILPLAYNLKVNLKNTSGEEAYVSDSTVIGVTTEYAITFDEENEDPLYDSSISFTSKGISLGQKKSKAELITLLGPSNSREELSDNEYEVGKITINQVDYSNFYVLIKDGEIVKIDMNKY